jgi:apolipoprotein N-acyltransferase
MGKQNEGLVWMTRWITQNWLFPFGLLLLNGVLLGFSAPGFGLWWLAWIALIPLFKWLQEQSGFGRACLGGLFFGLGYAGTYCGWLIDLHPLDWMGFSIPASLLTAVLTWLLVTVTSALIFSLLFGIYSRYTSGLFRLVVFPVLWVVLGSLLFRFELTMPWALLEYTQAPLILMRQLAGLFGFSGIVSLLLVFYNVLWAQYWQWASNASQNSGTAHPGASVFNHKKYALLAMALMVSVPLIVDAVGHSLEQDNPPHQRFPFPVLVVQGNIPIQPIRTHQLSADTAYQTYLKPVEHLALPRNTLVLFPEEGAVSGLVEQQNPFENVSVQQLQKLAHHKHWHIMAGITLKEYPSQQFYNSMALISHESRTMQFYQKRHLVPFGEYTPYGLEPFFKQLLQPFNIQYDTGFSAGHQSEALTIGKTRLGCLVCFELIDSSPFREGYAQQYPQKHVQLLINASNLGWFHNNTWLAKQFLAIGQFRAAETGCPLIMANNTGISAILSSNGTILRQTKIHHSIQYKTEWIFYNNSSQH